MSHHYNYFVSYCSYTCRKLLHQSCNIHYNQCIVVKLQHTQGTWANYEQQVRNYIQTVENYVLSVILICSCKMLSSNDTTIFCEEILKNSTLYHYQGNLNDSIYLSNISSLRIQSPCLNLIKHHLCYYYHPVCDLDSGDVIEPCNSNCEQLNSDPTCIDLIHNVTRELESVGLTFPNIKCLKAEAANSVATVPCLDLVNGKIKPPHHCVYINLLYT